MSERESAHVVLAKLTDADREAIERYVLSRILAVLDTVEKPGPVRIGADGSIERRAWELGMVKIAAVIAERDACAAICDAVADERPNWLGDSASKLCAERIRDRR